MSESTSDHPATERDTKEARLQHPSGFLYLTQHESVPILLDALLDLPPGREFNKTELADHAGVTRQTVSNYIDLLLEVNIIEEVPNTSPRRYQVAESDVVQELFELNGAINAAGD
jgi:DNA-binding MarR family transcriptional regulator